MVLGMAKGYVEFDGFDPRTEETATFRLSRDLCDRFARYAPAWKMADVFCVKSIVQRPEVAFIGLRTIDDQFREFLKEQRIHVDEPDPNGLCLAGRPAARRAADGRMVDPPHGKTFAVFVDPALTIMDWDWMETDSDGVSPIASIRRFGKRIWPKT